MGALLTYAFADDPNYFFRETAFLEVFLAFDAGFDNDGDEEEPESLD